MLIPTEPIGNLPRPPELIGALPARRETRVPLPGYFHGGVIEDLLREHETEVRRCVEKGAHGVQIDFTEGRSAVRSEPTGALPQLHVRNFPIARPGERHRPRVLKIVQDHLKPRRRIFVGLVHPVDPRLETPAGTCGRIFEAVKLIPTEQPGTTDDCGFSPFSDDTLTMRDAAFEKMRARAPGAAMAQSEAIDDE